MIEGTQVGAYRVLQQIGTGGMGSVWLAEHVALGRRAALKMLHPELSTRIDIVARFFNEARAATVIADPGIVQIFDFGQHVDGRAYIVMKWLDGEPLDRRLKREGALTLVDGLRLMRQVGPAQRFATAGELASAISALLGSSPQVPIVRASGYASAASPTTLSAPIGVSAPPPGKRSRFGMITVTAGLTEPTTPDAVRQPVRKKSKRI